MWARCEYDARGRLEKITNGRGQVLAYFYFDAWGGLERVEHDLDADGNAERTISYSYDPNGNLRSTADTDFLTAAPADPELLAGRLYRFDYDALDRVEAATAHFIGGEPVLSSGYDPFGNRDTLVLAQGTESLVQGLGYDLRNRLADVTVPGDAAPSLVFTYLANDALDTLTHGNGLVTNYDYHPEGALSSITVGASLQVLAYEVDGVLNVDTLTETNAGGPPASPGNVYDYSYDAAYRLVGASYPMGLGLPAPETFAYDAAGNRDDDAQSPTPWAYDASNRITASPGSPVICHDADGNLTTKRSGGDCTSGPVTETYTWDAGQRLTRYQGGGQDVAYRYDPFGRRISKQVAGGATTRYLWDGDRLLAEYDGSGTRLRRYAYAGGFAPVQMVEGAGGQCNDGLDNDGDGFTDTDVSETDCSSPSDPTEGTELDVHTDHLDTPRMLTAVDGASGQPKAVWRAFYAAFGEAAVDEDPDGDATSTTFNMRFPGQYYDAETGLHYNRFRYYDPEVGRYMSADPMEQEADLNRYRYALSNPATNIDPEGLFAFAGAGAAGGSIGLGSGAGAGTIGTLGPAAPVVAAGVAGAIVGTTINKTFEAEIDAVVDAAVERSRGDKWFCVARGNLVDFSGVCPDQTRCTGSAYGRTEALACRAAKRAASDSAPRGTYCRHIKCRCSKVQ